MGEGHYTALVLGVTGAERDKAYQDEDEDGNREVAPWAYDAIHGWEASYIETSYESREPWLGAFVELERTSMPLGSVEAIYAKQIATARESWERFRKLAADNGVEMPEGQLLLAFDYD